MRHFFFTILLLGAAAILHAEDQLKEVQIPFDGERFKHVKLYAPSAERGQIQIFREDGKLRLERTAATKKSKVSFTAPLFEEILADLRTKNLHPVEFVVGIRYDGSDMPQLETYLYSSQSKGHNSFFFRLKDGSAVCLYRKSDAGCPLA